MRKDRQLVAKAVLEGQLSADHLTMKEIREIEFQVNNLIMEKHMETLQLAGKTVFWDIDGTTGELN